MERNREARRGSMSAVNGGGLSSRRQRNGSLRNSPEEDGAVESAETSRLRDRTSMRDRERDRSSRSKRRRGDRLMHGGGGGGREDGEDSSDESVDDEEDDEDQSVSHRTSAPPAMMSPPTSSSSAQQNSHVRRSLPPARPVRPPPVWKVADEMIGVQVPRKARSASGKRLQESLVTSSGGGEQIHRQPSTSPARPSSNSTTHNVPSSSSASVKKKLKPIGGGGSLQHRPPKAASKPQSQDKIEIDVAEALFKMARQFECNPPKQDNQKLDSRYANGSVNNEVKSRASSPTSQPSSAALHNQGTSAPKRKRPRLIKYDEDNPAALPSSTAPKMEHPEQTVKSEASSPKLDQIVDSSKFTPDPVSSTTAAAAPLLADAQIDSGVKHENDQKPDFSEGDQTESSEVPRPAVDVRVDQSDNKLKSEPPAEKPPTKLIIDLMEPPAGKSSPDREDNANGQNNSSKPQIELAQKTGDSRRDDEKVEPKRNQEEITVLEDRKKLEPVTNDFHAKKPQNEPVTNDFHAKKPQNKGLDLQLDLEKPRKEIFATSKKHNQKQQQPKVSTKSESKSDKPVSAAVSMPFPMPVSGWPGNLNPFGYMGQVPSLSPVLPVDGSSGTTKSLIPPQRPKRCATHCYIAKSILYYQQLAKMNAFWPTAAGPIQLYGGKPYNLNAVPPESAISNSLQGNLQGRSLSSVPDKGGSLVGNGYMAPACDKSSAASNSVAEAQKKQLMLQEMPQPVSANTMLHGPAFIFPVNQHTAGATAASTAAPKSAAGNSCASSTTANTGAATASGGSATAVNFNFTSLPPNEAQYLTILQNNGYPFPIPAHVSPYGGASPTLAMPFFSGSFYSSRMIHPSQVQQPPAGQHTPHANQGHQNTSTSSGSSSSQKLQQNPKRVPGGGGPSVTAGSSHSLPSSKQHHHTAEMKQDSSLANDSRVSQAQKNIHGHNFPMPIVPQNFAVISPAAAMSSALGGTSGNQNEKQQAPRAFAMSYTSLAGTTGATAPGPPPPCFDFSTMSQNHPLFRSLPEAAGRSYQFPMAAASAAQIALQKKTNHQEDGKSIGETMVTSTAGEDERKGMAASKGPASGLQHSPTFSRPDGEASMSSIMDSSSRMLNLIQAASSGGQVPNRSSNGVPTTSSSNTITTPGVQQQQQQIIQLQKQQLQQLQLQHQLTSRPKSSERFAGGSSAAKFPQTLSGFPQALIPAGNSPSQSPQWKSSSRLSATPLQSPSTVSSSNKSQVPQQPSRVSQPNQPAPSHQTHISFGGKALKMAVGSMGGQCTLPSLSSASSVMVGSLPNAVNKGATIGSPQASPNVKAATPAPTSLSSLPQPSEKNSASNSSLKTSSVSNRNMPSILGQPHISSGPMSSSSSSTKQQQQQSQTQQKQPFPQPQLFFSGAYMPSQTSQGNAIAYYQRHQPELQSQQHNSNLTTLGVLSLCSAATHTVADASKTMVAAGSLKGLPAHGLLQHPGQAASGTPYPLITAAAAAGFPYISSMQSVTVKSPDQKPAAGN